MLAEVLNFIRDDINQFIQNKLGQNGTFLIGANYNNLTDQQANVKNIVMSLANLEHESLLKSPENFVREPDVIKYQQPPLWMNCVCVFIFNSMSKDNYEGINLLELVVKYFQSKPRITQDNALLPVAFPQGIEEIRTELISLNFEQNNYLWGQFGSKYQPSVVYKFKSLPIDNNEIDKEGPPVLDTEVNAVHKKK